jgi:eukaryotic-like serine/threonine-protein kinase
MKIDPATWPTLSKLLDDWLDQPPDSRSRWLADLGPEYSDVLPALRQLLVTQANAADDFLQTLPKFNEPPESAINGFEPQTEVGPYRLIRELGQGGMGVVWLAERADGEVKRPVALKLPILSLHNRTLADRFTRERDILAQLTHPSIARLYDAGISDRGQPYLALEYVEGEKITACCDQRNLGLKPRLQLFLQVLRAVQYAHSNLIVHRDLKPANILVTSDGEVRLLDFGIAKLLTEGEALETELTRLGGRALTPDYASPEQITGATITTATDIYSLGVILYELLTGARPYKLKRDTRSGLEDAILEAEPERPSQAAPRQLARGLRGDLDAIILKVLGKQPQERYASADAFAQDIERHLEGQAVLAQPESVWYRARKFVARNKLAVGAAAAIILALSIGLGVALWEAHLAQIQTRTAQTIQTFLLDIFRANSNEHADPVKARQTTARELLDLGAKKIDGALQDAPAAKLSLLETLFQLYADLGLQDQAFALGRSRVALAKSVYGPNHPEVARALVDLAANSGESSFVNDNSSLLKEAGTILDRNRDFKSCTRAIYFFGMAEDFKSSDLAKAAGFAAESVKIYRSRFSTVANNFQKQLRATRKPPAWQTLCRALLEAFCRRSMPYLVTPSGKRLTCPAPNGACEWRWTWPAP